MLTRGAVYHQYYPAPVGRIDHNGTVRVNVVKNIPQTWAVSRPVSAPDPNGAPFYFRPDNNYAMMRGGSVALTPLPPRVEMDPSDRATWQRPYAFS